MHKIKSSGPFPSIQKAQPPRLAPSIEWFNFLRSGLVQEPAHYSVQRPRYGDSNINNTRTTIVHKIKSSRPFPSIQKAQPPRLAPSIKWFNFLQSGLVQEPASNSVQKPRYGDININNILTGVPGDASVRPVKERKQWQRISSKFTANLLIMRWRNDDKRRIPGYFRGEWH